MNANTLELAVKLNKQANSLKNNIERLELACSDNFKEREAIINIYGTNQNEGAAYIPKSIFKNICKTALLACRDELRRTIEDFEKL